MCSVSCSTDRELWWAEPCKGVVVASTLVGLAVEVFEVVVTAVAGVILDPLKNKRKIYFLRISFLIIRYVLREWNNYKNTLCCLKFLLVNLRGFTTILHLLWNYSKWIENRKVEKRLTCNWGKSSNKVSFMLTSSKNSSHPSEHLPGFLGLLL